MKGASCRNRVFAAIGGSKQIRDREICGRECVGCFGREV